MVSLHGYSQKLSIEINEQSKKDFVVKGVQKLKLSLVQNKDYPNEVIIRFNYYDVKSPKELGLNRDGRKLALLFKWIKLI